MGITDTIIANNYAGSSIPSPAGVRGLPLLVRRAQVFYAATTVFADYKLCQWRCNQMDSNDIRVDSLWDEAHARNARFLCNQFLNLEGLWVKMGQYLSSRADVMPDAYLKELAKCQDSLPGRPFKDVKLQVEQELRRPIYEVFESVEEKPIACASIAQVHRAKLIGGKDVVIKVQHAQIAQRILQDLQNLETIGDTLKRLDPDFDMTPVIREWAKEVPKELDFRQVALNMQRVEKNLAPLGPQKIQHAEHGDKVSELVIDVSFPQVIDGLVTEKLLVMTYIDGFKIDDKPRLDDHQADRSSLILNVTRAFAHQIFCDGFFQADCHPGNLLVDRDTLKPVLLDFGLTKEIAETTRFYFAKLLVAAAEQDIYGLLDALEGVGLRLRPDVPFDAALLAKYFFRDANRQGKAREESQERREEYRKKAAEREKHIYVGDKVDVVIRYTFSPFKGSRKGEVTHIEAAKKEGNGEDKVTIKLATGEEIVANRADVKIQKSRSPIDAWPDAFIFFDRVLGLLRGLTASLDVPQSYLEVMTPYARKALRDHHQNTVTATTSPGTTAVVPIATNSASMLLSDTSQKIAIAEIRGHDNLDGVVTDAVRELLQSEDLLGCQVCVIEDDKTVVDICAGFQSPYDLHPVTPGTLFNCFSVTKGVAAAAVHILAQRGLLSINDPVCKYWPEFAQNGKDKITIAHVLNHQAGLSNACIDELWDDPYMISDSDKMLELLAVAEPDAPPGKEVKYHYFTFGWLVDGIVRGATGGTPLREFVQQNIADKLSISNEFMIGIGAEGRSDASIAPRLATLVMSRKAQEAISTAASQGPPNTAVQSARSTAEPVASTSEQKDKDRDEIEREEAAMTESYTEKENVETENEDEKPTQAAKRRPPSGPSLLINPTFFNNPRVREASMPAANGHFSARALARFYHSLSRDAIKSATATENSLFPSSGWTDSFLEISSDGDSKGLKVDGGATLQGGSGHFRDGFAMYPDSITHTESPHGVLSFGHGGVGGSVALCRIDPATGHKLSVAITLNRLSMDNRLVTGKIIRAIYKKLNLAVPQTYELPATAPTTALTSA